MTPYKSLYTEAKITEKYKLFNVKFNKMNYIKVLYSLHYIDSFVDEKIDLYQSLIEYLKLDNSNRNKNWIIEKYYQLLKENNNTIDESVVHKFEIDCVTEIDEQIYTLKNIAKVVNKDSFGIDWEHLKYTSGSTNNDNYVDLLNTIYYIGYLESYDYDPNNYSKGYIRNTKRVSNQSLYDEFKSKSSLSKPIRIWFKQ